MIRLAPSSLPRLAAVHLGTTTVLFALAIGLAAGLVFALFPVIRSAIDYAPLREGGRGLTTSRAQLRVRSALVTVTHYTAEGSAEIAGESTDLVLARHDGHLHALSRDPDRPDELVPTVLDGKEGVRDRLAGLLA